MQLLRKLLFPISLVYGSVVFFRNLCYDLGVFKSETFETPTICVGNLSVGGTGKTPMVELLLRLLWKTNHVAVLSRGYKRKSKGFQIANANSTVEELGDEPYQIHLKFPEVTVAVDADRRNGILKLAEKINPNLILLDDAFQHRKVKAGFNILLTSFDNLYVKDWFLPTGNLRDAKNQAKRANLIVVTKCPENLSLAMADRIISEIKPNKAQKVLFASLEYANGLKGKLEDMDITNLNVNKFTLVTGIADPEPLAKHLKSLGLDFEHETYPDHHDFAESEINELSKKKMILTTEKDFVRLKTELDNLFYLEVKHKFLFEGQRILEREIKQFLN